MKKKFFAFIMSAVIMITAFAFPPKDGMVSQEEKVSADASGYTSSQAINWCNSVVGKAFDMDGLWGAQCVEFINAYLQFLGLNYTNYLVQVAADFRLPRFCPPGWQQLAGVQPQKGDVLIYTGGVWSDYYQKYCGHVAIYESDTWRFEQNYANKQYVIHNNVHYRSSDYWGVLRPNFKPDKILPDPPGTIANINEGIYVIKNVGTGLVLNYDTGYNTKPIDAWMPDGSPEQRFRVVSVGGGKYKMEIQHPDGGLFNFGVANGTEVGDGVLLCRWGTYDNDNTQQVYFRKVGTNQYVITSTKGKGVVGVTSSNENQMIYTQAYEAGNQKQIWTLLSDTNQDPETVPDALPAPVQVSEGIYNIKNTATGLFMNYDTGFSDKPINAWMPDGSPEQKFRIVSVGNNKYKAEIQHPDGGVLNFNADNGTVIGTGIKLTRWPAYENDNTQEVYFRKVGDNKYVITSSKGEGVVGVTSSEEMQRLYTQSYQKGNSKQIWELVRCDQPVPETTKPVVTTTRPATTVTTTAAATTVTTGTVISKKLLYGIDVSGFQYDIDWTAVKASGLDFAIIRAGTTLNDDTETFYSDRKFDVNYSGAKNAGMNIGLYYYCGALTEAGFKQCACDFIEYLDGRTAQYPVYIDVEASSGQTAMGKAKLTSYILSALEIIKKAGYRAGVYANQNWFTNYVDADRIRSAGYEIWWAQYPSGEYAVDPKGYDKSSVCGIWQYSSKGKINGISTNVDLDVAYVDYAAMEPPVKPDATEPEAAEPALSVDISLLTLSAGEQYAITVNQSGLTYKSSNPDAVIVSKSGVVTALADGRAVITVINADSDAVSFTVNVADRLPGDINGDRKVNVSDIVALQKWLAKSGDIISTNADMDSNGKINIFDMITLRRAVISNV